MNGESHKTEQENTIDILKLFFSLCVTAIHTALLQSFSVQVNWYITHLVFRLAVPFYFCVSGYFLGLKSKNIRQADSVFVSYRKRLYCPFLAWGGAGLIFYGIWLYKDGASAAEIIFKMMQSAVFYPRGAMWFAAACITASFILQKIVEKNLRILPVTLTALCLYLFALLGNTYFFLIQDFFFGKLIKIYLYFCISARNGVFLFLFFWSGYLLSVTKIKDYVLNHSGIGIVAVILSYIGLIAETVFCYGKNVADDSSLFFSFIILIPMMTALSLKFRCSMKLPYRKFRTASTVFFFSHSFVYMALEIFVLPKSGGISEFLITAAVCVFIWFIYERMNLKVLRAVF